MAGGYLFVSFCSAPVVRLGITLPLDGGVMFDASLHAEVIRQSHSGGLAHIVVAFALFRRSAVRLLIT